MKEQINPGYSNQIYVENQPYIHATPAHILVNDKEKEWILQHEFEPSVIPDYIAVTTKATYTEKTFNGNAEIDRVLVRVRYRIVKNHDLTAEELYPIITHSTALLIECFYQQSALLKNIPVPKCPLLSEIENELKKLAADLNISNQV